MRKSTNKPKVTESVRTEPKPAPASNGAGSASPRAQPPADRAAVPIERIRARAYELWEARKGAPGDPVSDWLQAERELAAAATAPTASPRDTMPRPNIQIPERSEPIRRG